jgi:hypothetical protein
MTDEKHSCACSCVSPLYQPAGALTFPAGQATGARDRLAEEEAGREQLPSSGTFGVPGKRPTV